VKAYDVQYVSVSDAIAIHDDQIARYGGGTGIFDGGKKLEAAIMAVQATCGSEPLLGSIAEIAAAYALYIATSHPFVDGNKRTALAVALTFLRAHGYTDVLGSFDDWERIMVEVACGRLNQEQLAQFFAAHMGDWGVLT
jgi:death on curing protein